MHMKWNPRSQDEIDRAADELERVLADALRRLDARGPDPVEAWPDHYLRGAA